MKMISIAAGLALSIAACGGSSSPAGPDAPAAGGCSLAGNWTVTGSSGTTYDASANGTAVLTINNGAGTVTETWTEAGGTVSFTDTAATGVGTNQECQGVTGQYGTTYAADCKTVSFALVGDACAPRAQIVSHASMTRP